MDQKDYFRVFAGAVDLRGKRVLEVGGSIPPSVIEKTGVRAWHSINISERYAPEEKLPKFYATYKMSVTKMDFGDEQFDAVFSSNCFEHVDDVAAAFQEIYRVLKPGGVFFTIFGPIWSGPVGHHTWVYDRGRPLTFNDNVFPGWAHLTHTRAGLGLLLDGKYPPETVEAILRYVYDSKDVNRNPDSLYDREMSRLNFVPIIRYRIKARQRLCPNHLARLQLRHPDVDNFNTTGFFWVFAKDKCSPRQYLRAWAGSVWELIVKKALEKIRRILP